MPDSSSEMLSAEHHTDPTFFRILDDASVGVAVYSLTGSLVYTNASLERLTGYDASVFSSAFAPLPGGSAGFPEQAGLFNALAAGEREHGSMTSRMLHRDGRVLAIQLDMHLVYDVQSNSRFIVRQLSVEEGAEAQQGSYLRSERDKAYVALQLLTQVILQEHTLDGLMTGIHNVLRQLMPAESCSIALTSGPGSCISFPYFADIKREPPSSRRFGHGLTEFVFIWGKPFLLKRAEIEALECNGRVCPASPRPAVWLGVPLRTHAGHSVGVLAVRSYSDGDAYSPEDLKLLELISSYVGGAIETFRQQEALRESEERFRAVFQHSGLGVCMVDASLAIQDCNRRAAEMVAEDILALKYAPVTRFIAHESDRDALCRQFERLCLGESSHFTTIVECRLAGDTHFWCRMTFTAVQTAKAGFSFAVVLLEDITEHKLADDKLMHMAFHDALTGLPNRSLFMDRLSGAVRRAKRHGDYHFAVLFMDMDRFKVVNDSMGHKAGDALLVQFATRVKRCLRESDTFARFGGDEFAVLMDEFDDVLQAAHIVQRIQDEFVLPFKVEGVEVYSGASIGVVLRAREYERAEDILRDADAAMYRAKEGGSGRYEIFDRTLHTHMQDMLQLENAIRRGLEFAEFSPVFQPYVTLQSGRVRGAEALVRWHQPGGDIIHPSAFIAQAEEAGLVFELDCLMLEQSCTMLAEWQKAGTVGAMNLNLNVSALTLQRWNMVEVFTAILRRSGCRPSDICLEITENTLLKGEEAVARRLWKLKELGVRIALDDFGTGFSSFNYLRQFPVNMIKVDRIFSSTVHEDRASYGIVQAMVSLGRGLGIEVVAEGVENSEQAQVLVELGCEAAQGFYYSQPVEAERLRRIMQHGRLPMAVG